MPSSSENGLAVVSSPGEVAQDFRFRNVINWPFERVCGRADMVVNGLNLRAFIMHLGEISQ